MQYQGVGGSLQATCLISLEREFMKNLLMRLWKEEEGQDLTEYALLLVLLSLAAIGSIGGLATAINGTFANASTALKNTTT
jgi:pilus assembly protein Flp/PilA